MIKKRKIKFQVWNPTVFLSFVNLVVLAIKRIKKFSYGLWTAVPSLNFIARGIPSYTK